MKKRFSAFIMKEKPGISTSDIFCEIETFINVAQQMMKSDLIIILEMKEFSELKEISTGLQNHFMILAFMKKKKQKNNQLFWERENDWENEEKLVENNEEEKEKEEKSEVVSDEEDIEDSTEKERRLDEEEKAEFFKKYEIKKNKDI